MKLVGLMILFFCSIRLTVVSIIYGLYKDDIEKCHAPVELEVFFIGVIVLNVAVILNEIAIMYVSMQGSVPDTNSRRHMPMLMYIQLALYVPEVSWTALGTYWAVSKSYDCGIGFVVAVCVSVGLQWMIVLAVIIVTLVMFDPLGALHDVDNPDDGDGESTKQVIRGYSARRA